MLEALIMIVVGFYVLVGHIGMTVTFPWKRLRAQSTTDLS
ncbi:hypothetical protein A6F65_01249 [Paraurantiacibacter namhicola]|uniref:Uncharacterized protein n=1 Tax=Paraurantiacibacter namhicola TaxID=645517 RepID=A0A1C7D7U4_9SPHN|nr:hypothetical protein A6F65_01249 [Paraurantiacibacter namhicola]